MLQENKAVQTKKRRQNIKLEDLRITEEELLRHQRELLLQVRIYYDTRVATRLPAALRSSRHRGQSKISIPRATFTYVTTPDAGVIQLQKRGATVVQWNSS